MRTRTPVALLLALVLVAACGVGRTQADQDRDAGLVAGALRAAWIDGTGFTLDHQLQLAGGDIPSGQAVQFHGTVSSGVLHGSTARFAYRLDQGQQGGARYDMLVAGGLVYVRRQDASTSWVRPVTSIAWARLCTRC